LGLALEPVAGSALTVASPQAIAIDEDYTAQHSPIIYPRFASALGKKLRHV
jgi:hypothetical protein